MIVAWLCLLSFILTDATTLSVSEDFEPSKTILIKREVQNSCDKGWFPFEDKCYGTGGIKQLRLNWENAAASCRVLGAKLASIHSRALSDFLTAFILMNVQHNSWIGLNDRDNESHYKWEDGTEVDFTNWEPDEPSGLNLEKEDCVEFLYYSGRQEGKPGMWNDLECGHDREFICQKRGRKQGRRNMDPRFCSPRIGGWKLKTSCYHIISEKLTWQEAEAHCIENHNGHLVTINDFSVNLFIEYIVKNYTEDMWIGIKIKNELQQQWSSGWYVAFNNWMEEPGDFVEGTCAIRTLDKWTTVPCIRRMSFICEISTEHVPSLKSSEDLFCPEEPTDWKDFGGEFCYYIENDHLTWFEANFRCLRRGGSLASFHSKAELDIVQPFLMTHFVKARLFSWIGLHRHMRYDEEFVWADGSPMDFKAWATNEPNSQREQCGEVNPNSMEWNDYFCDHHRPSVCSIRKISSNRTTSSKLLTPVYSSGYSTGALLGVIFCVMLVAILLGTIIYFFCTQAIEERHKRKASRTSHHPPSRDQRSKYRSENEIVIADDGYVKNIDDVYENP